MQYLINPKTGEIKEVEFNSFQTSVSIPQGWKWTAVLEYKDWMEIIIMLNKKLESHAPRPETNQD